MKSSKIFMVRPAAFGFNPETAGSNSFQQKGDNTDGSIIQQKALQEFDAMVAKLKAHDIDVVVFEDTLTPHTPDAVFPNNWISFHENNTITLYPMLAKARRLERRNDIVDKFKSNNTTIIDLSVHEKEDVFLEGTGSIVFDYQHKIAYANISPRTNKILLEKFCKQINYTLISFKAVDEKGSDIYHTNVLMCVGNAFAILCKSCITNNNELKTVTDALEKTGHEIIDISYAQMNSFAGNMYQLFNKKGESFLVCSEQAYKSLQPAQVTAIEKYATILHSPIYTIEKHGGGSARCMIADIKQF